MEKNVMTVDALESGAVKSSIKILHEARQPKFAVITPLWTGHTISKRLKQTIKATHNNYIWISSEGENNIPTNLQAGLDWLQKNKGLPEYYAMVDRDIELGRNCLDNLYEVIKRQPFNIALAYASFAFKGAVNMKFPAREWDYNRLIRGNYISSNSMFRSAVTLNVGLVTDEKYKRLLDYAFLLKLAKAGYSGVPVPEASFVAWSEAGSISAGSQEDYVLKYRRVMEDFVL